MSSPNVPPATPSAATSGNVAPAADEEVVFYEGSPKLRGETRLLLTCSLIALVILGIGFVIGHFVFEGHWGRAWLPLLICLLLAIGVILLPSLLVKRNKYRISNYRIDHEQGLLSKRIDSIELWHVEDVRMDQSFFDRMLGVGTVSIHSNDRTNPVLPLRSLPEPRKIFDAIKQRVIAVKRQRGVLKIDGGGADLAPDAHHGS
ncbi:MAG: PH domain-containing protein [Tepidisphaeraceae bacterium]